MNIERERLILKLKSDQKMRQLAADSLAMRGDFEQLITSFDAHPYVSAIPLILAIKEVWESIAIEEEATRDLERPIREVCSVDAHA